MGRIMLVFAVCATLAACSQRATPMSVSQPEPNIVDDPSALHDWPASLRAVGDGYPMAGHPCRKVGENEATRRLDDSADLVGCPSEEAARALGGTIVDTVHGITLVSVPRKDAKVTMREIGAGSDAIFEAGVTASDDPSAAAVACSVTGGETRHNCPASLMRDPRGDGVHVVEVTKPDGVRRAILFKDGKPLDAESADGDGSADYAFSFMQQGDEFLVCFGRERYRIPEAFAYGD